MDLKFTEEQQIMRETTQRLCNEAAPFEVVREMEDDPTGYPESLWTQMGELGLTGLTLPEEYGGAGLSALEAVVVYEEFGRSLAPSPHFVSAVLSGGALALAGSEEQKQEWLPRIASGEAILTPACLEPKGGCGPEGVQLKAVADGDKFLLSGTKRHVEFASAATRLVVLARTGDGVDLFLVDPKSPGVELTQQYSIGSSTQYQVVLNDVSVPASDRIGPAQSGWETWNRVMHEGIILLAAQAMGGAQQALDLTVQYSKEREQFNKPLAAFQALSHYMADASAAIDGGTTLVYEAAWASANGKSISRLAPMAKLFTCQTYRDATATFMQIFGGYGFTLDYDIQLYFRRAKQLQLSWWDSRYLEELVACDVLDQGFLERLTNDGRRSFAWPVEARPSGAWPRAELAKHLAKLANCRGRVEK